MITTDHKVHIVIEVNCSETIETSRLRTAIHSTFGQQRCEEEIKTADLFYIAFCLHQAEVLPTTVVSTSHFPSAVQCNVGPQWSIATARHCADGITAVNLKLPPIIVLLPVCSTTKPGSAGISGLRVNNAGQEETSKINATRQ